MASPGRNGRAKVMEMFENGEFDVCTLFYASLQIGDRQVRSPSS
jgi:hypothetical protein